MIDARDAGKNGDNLDRRQMREARRDQQQQDHFETDGCPQALERVELAVEFQHRLGDSVISEVAQHPACNSAEDRRGGRHQRISIGAVAAGKGHGHEEDIGGDEEDRAFNESDDGKPHFGGFSARQRHSPIVEPAQHESIPNPIRRALAAWRFGGNRHFAIDPDATADVSALSCLYGGTGRHA